MSSQKYPHNHNHNHNADSANRVYICRNCGMNGHVYKSCPHPIVSFGLICYRYIHGVPEYLMIQRKDSLSFMEFIRGKYEPTNVKYISKLLSHMTTIERTMLLENTFEQLWNHIWFQKVIQRHTADYDEASNKFQQIVSGVEIALPTLPTESQESILTPPPTQIYTLESLVHATNTPFTEPEWGFPKGRRRLRESDVGCAVREFCEETGFTAKDVRICQDIKPFEEVFYGTNEILYRHVYFIAELMTNREREVVIDPLNINQAREVQRASWFNYQEVLEHIRKHNLERKELFACAHKAVSSMCEKLAM